MKRYYPIYILAFLAAAVMPYQASAQNLDPTVEVNRAYEGKLIEVDKPSIEMAVPDSVLRFDLDFDYAVFENPYKGAYEFKPYAMTMQPVKAPSAQNSFYLKAGAGLRPVSLSVMPVFDMVWAPVTRNQFKMNVYAGHDSYIGRYMNMPSFDPASAASVDVLKMKGETGRGYYDLFSKAGVDGRYDWDEGTVKMDVGYLGIAEKYDARDDLFNGLNVSASVASKDLGQLFNYEAGASYSFGNDRLEYADKGKYGLSEHDVRVFGRLKASLMENHKMLFELGVDNVSYSGEFSSGTSRLVFAPAYQFRIGRLDVDAGFRVEAIVPGRDSSMFASKGQYIYPDVTVAYHLIPEMMKVYAHVGGGTKMNTFSSLLKENHHLDLFSAFDGPLMDNTIESVSVAMGLKGRAGSVFAYDLRGGYADYSNALLEKIVIAAMPGSETLKYLPGIGYSPYRKAFAEADMRFENEGLKADARVKYNHCWFKDGVETAGLFLPAALEGEASVMYGWNRRVYLGLDCIWSTARRSGTVLYQDGTLKKASVPGYADLGVDFEYLASRKFSFWMRGGNLLNMAVQRNLLYAETGPYFALGICLNL